METKTSFAAPQQFHLLDPVTYTANQILCPRRQWKNLGAPQKNFSFSEIFKKNPEI
jgi:hypothetical protein